MKNKRLLTREYILHIAEQPEGYRLLYDFVKAVEASKTPDSKTLKELAVQFRGIVFEGEDPKEALKLKKRRGRKRTAETAGKELQTAVALLTRIREGKNWSEAASCSHHWRHWCASVP